MNETAAPKFEPKELKKIETDQQVCLVRFSPCGQFLFGGGYERSAAIGFRCVADAASAEPPATWRS